MQTIIQELRQLQTEYTDALSKIDELYGIHSGLEKEIEGLREQLEELKRSS